MLALQAPALAAFGAARGYGVRHSASEGALVGIFVVAAWVVRDRRRLSSAVASFGLMTACALLVHFWDGAIEAHFAFFVMVGVIALYEDWMPFLLALGFVVGEHAVIGVLSPHAVYNHPAATAHPWEWALIHGAFIAAAGAASITAWRFNEEVRAETRRAAADAEAARTRLSGLVRGLDAIVWEADPQTFRFTFVNERAEELLGYPIERWAEPGFWASILHPEDRAWAVEFCTQVTAAARDHDFDYRAVAADGRTVWLRDLVRVVVDEAGVPVQLRGLMVDITRQKEAEEELRRQASIVQTVLDTTPDGIRLVDSEGNVVLSNAAVERMGSDSGAPLGSGTMYERAGALAERTTDPGAFLAAMQALASDPQRVARDEYELAASGQVFQRYSAPVRMASDPGTLFGRLFVHREVTAERRAERAKDEFVALASHELRTPLTSIRGYLEMLVEGDVGEVPADQRRVLGIIERNADRLVRLVDDVLAVAKADAGRLGLVRERLDLGALVGDCVQAALPLAHERTIALAAEVEPAAVMGDRARLSQLVDNLLSNALKFTPAGGTVRLGVRAEDGRAVLEVRDTGIGIPASEQGFLFERFYRGSAATASAVPGTGLGLAISQMIAQAHGGRIDVSSEVGRGTTFRVEFPLTTPAEANAPA